MPTAVQPESLGRFSGKSLGSFFLEESGAWGEDPPHPGPGCRRVGMDSGPMTLETGGAWPSWDEPT